MRLEILALTAVLFGCSGESSIALYPLDQVPASTRISIPYQTVELRSVSLPLYAEAEEIPILVDDGSIRTNSDLLWADAPERAVTEQLVRSLAGITGAVVAAEPWPLEDFPTLRIEVRVNRLLASGTGPLEFTGTWFASARDRRGRDVTQPFEISVPFEGEGLAARTTAQSEATRQLAELIAKRLAR